ncbi:hypothetical protein [Gordonia neofelifaecis]|uniref:Uncharacterized protein n=1 Tax=Gordonia neofelifaecis NRRL B-59395 TaxID=644548 RepID=F1YNL4_9ACTN|nr:hypothetical protein [Gordonia neofelifaecis]EGD53751.1 hypothetical protein SCNU_17480 [Gordonia neofelifaecis NRRL B-59395]
MALRVQTGKAVSPANRHSTIRGDLAVLLLAILAVAGVLVHNRVDTPDEPLLSPMNVALTAVYLVLAILGFMRITRPAASWMLMIWAWIMVVASLISLMPQATWAGSPTNVDVHYGSHVLFGACQIPLIIILIRRLNGDVCRWTAPR